jgi:hypothetical protein
VGEPQRRHQRTRGVAGGREHDGEGREHTAPADVDADEPGHPGEPYEEAGHPAGVDPVRQPEDTAEQRLQERNDRHEQSRE